MERTMLDDVRRIPTAALWIGTFFIVMIAVNILTPWQALEHVLVNQGVGDEGSQMLAFIAGFTLPLTTGFMILSLLFLRKPHLIHLPPYIPALIIAGVLWLCGELAREFGLGLLPDYYHYIPYSPHPNSLFRPLQTVLIAYANSYGLGLSLSALAIGFAAAVQVDRWLYRLDNGLS